MAQVTNETVTSDKTVNDGIKNKTAAAASFKKLQPEEFYRHYIEKVRNQGWLWGNVEAKNTSTR